MDLFRPGGEPDSIQVQPGDEIEVPGDPVVIVADPLNPREDDAWIVSSNGVERAWPKATWDLVEDKPAKSAPVKES